MLLLNSYNKNYNFTKIESSYNTTILYLEKLLVSFFLERYEDLQNNSWQLLIIKYNSFLRKFTYKQVIIYFKLF